MRMRCAWMVFGALWLSGCTQDREAVDGQLATEISGIKAIDNHAHPVLVAAGDREFDALPVDNMEPQSDPVAQRPGVWKTPFTAASKAAAKAKYGDGYPAWVLDQIGVETMLANRVAMGASVQPPRFRWVPYADALLFPLDTTQIASRNPDRKAFFALEDKLRARLSQRIGRQRRARHAGRLPDTRSGHRLSNAIQAGGALAEKFEAAYLRTRCASIRPVRIRRRRFMRIRSLPMPTTKSCRTSSSVTSRANAGGLGWPCTSTRAAGAGGYFDVAGANPLNLESVLDDPSLRKTKFVMLHGGWPFTREIGALMTKPNAYLDFSQQSLLVSPATLAVTLREWLEVVPEKILFATDGYPFSDELGWEESAWVGAKQGREALGRALTGMLRDGVVTHARAVELARMVLRDNARKLYGM